MWRYFKIRCLRQIYILNWEFSAYGWHWKAVKTGLFYLGSIDRNKEEPTRPEPWDTLLLEVIERWNQQRKMEGGKQEKNRV